MSLVLLSFGLILIVGLIVGLLFEKFRIPGLVGMILAGILIGPNCLNILDESLLSISSILRSVALIIILTRSGLNLDFKAFKQIGIKALLLSFIPATLEIVGVTIASCFLLEFNILEGLLLGSVLAAVSPAVVSPRMISLIEAGYGKEKEVPKLVLVGASLDDIYVIILFYVFLALVDTQTLNMMNFITIPVSIIIGILIGLICGVVIGKICRYLDKITNIIVILACSLSLYGLEIYLKNWVSFSSLLSILVMAMLVLLHNPKAAEEINDGYKKIWKVFEIILFVLVGANLNIKHAFNNSFVGVMVLIIGLFFRMVGVFFSVSNSNLAKNEKLFVIFSYLPKATVQASIASIALSMGLDCGEMVLSIGVLTILVTAPLGAFLIDRFAKKLLTIE